MDAFVPLVISNLHLLPVLAGIAALISWVLTLSKWRIHRLNARAARRCLGLFAVLPPLGIVVSLLLGSRPGLAMCLVGLACLTPFVIFNPLFDNEELGSGV
jgi:hypothetical protein